MVERNLGHEACEQSSRAKGLGNPKFGSRHQQEDGDDEVNEHAQHRNVSQRNLDGRINHHGGQEYRGGPPDSFFPVLGAKHGNLEQFESVENQEYGGDTKKSHGEALKAYLCLFITSGAHEDVANRGDEKGNGHAQKKSRVKRR
mmetsp:Transcript_37718/g.38085  ORF Transcript_37718/g.38085 Transcript_37718/m.38085 type:complete len:144 (-) Transcript_37718:162-593(-)